MIWENNINISIPKFIIAYRYSQYVIKWIKKIDEKAYHRLKWAKSSGFSIRSFIWDCSLADKLSITCCSFYTNKLHFFILISAFLQLNSIFAFDSFSLFLRHLMLSSAITLNTIFSLSRTPGLPSNKIAGYFSIISNRYCIWI